MIAPLRLPEPHTSRRSRRLAQAREVVAATFLHPKPQSSDRAPRIPAWRAWLFVAWVLVVAGAYVAWMMRLF